MTALALSEVQRALYSKLSGDAVLMGLVTGVYDAVPQAAALPYIRIGEGETRTLPADGITLTELVLDLEIWSEAAGRKTTLLIMNRLFALLHLGTLTLTGFQLITIHCEQAQTAIADTAKHVRGDVRVRITVMEA